MKVLVCGSRAWRNVGALVRRIDALPDNAIVLHGDAKGADRLADRIARRRGLAVHVYPADWERDGKAAGIIRNRRMLDQQPDIVVAFWDGQSKGTGYTIAEAERRGIPVEVISA